MRPRLGMLAYACDPEGAGEHWLGWGWAETAAEFCDVTLHVPSKARKAIEARAAERGIAVRFVDIPGWLRWCSERMGAFGLWWRKIAWAKRACRAVAREQGAFDLLHHTTFHTFRVPFYAASLGIPSIWGPMAGGESTPEGFEEILGPGAAAEEKRRRQNQRWLGWPAVQRALADCSIIFASNRTTLNFLPEFARSKAVIVPANSAPSRTTPLARSPRGERKGLRLVYAGNCVATRGMPLVFRAMREVPEVSLKVAGTGPALEWWRREAEPLGARVEFCGQVPRAELMRLYEEADALAFPALRDSGGSALIEAMALGLPVICLDWAGPGEIIDGESGIKIEAKSVSQVVRDLAAAFRTLAENPEVGAKIAEAARVRVERRFTWEAKREVLERSCRRLLEK